MMKTFTKLMGSVLLALPMTLVSQSANSQCTLTNPAGQSVTFSITPVSIISPSTCPTGYNYNVAVNYSITAPAGVSFYGVDGSFKCDADAATGFHIGALGSGSLNTYTSWTAKTNCATATPSNLLCNTLSLSANINGSIVNGTCAFASTSIPLPVNLLSFDARMQQGKVNLVWVASENNNAAFILERSSDAKSWKAIYKATGDRTADLSNTYSYTDELPATGTNYYRIQEVGANGSGAYSRVLAVEAIANKDVAVISPNPTNGTQVKITGLQTPADWSVKVMNTTSSVVYQSATVGEYIALPTVPAGLYYVQLHNSKTGKTTVVKMMKN